MRRPRGTPELAVEHNDAPLTLDDVSMLADVGVREAELLDQLIQARRATPMDVGLLMRVSGLLAGTDDLWFFEQR